MGGAGHLLPVVAAATALRRLGHEPVLLVAPSVAERAAETGLELVVGEQPSPAAVTSIWDRLAAGPPADVEYLVDRELFAGLATEAMLPSATAAGRALAPALIVREPCEYATAVIAHRMGVPQAQVAISQSSIEAGVLAHVADGLDRLAPGVGAAIAAAPFLTPFPASLDPSPWADTRRFRSPAPAAAALPDWWPQRRSEPLVYVTFGSVLGHLSHARDVFAVALRAVDGLPVRVLLTVGAAVDPASLGPVPANTHVERWVPQPDALAAADLVVCHGGSGTVLGTLGAGVPLVVCPLFADQRANAALVVDAGAGVPVAPSRPVDGAVGTLVAQDAPRLRDAVVSLLSGADGPRRRARAVADEIAGVPALEDRLAGLTAAR
jgi:UDP:flavonoid glycosyltransferase YjiC (YdhE family)